MSWRQSRLQFCNEVCGEDAFRWGGPNRGLMFGVWANVLMLVAGLVALPFDHRIILGINPWIKPAKFEVSVIVLLLTFAVLLSALGRLGAWPRVRAILGWGLSLSMVFENGIIALQSVRGVRSHMNYTTLLDGLLFAAMGVLVALAMAQIAIVLVLYLSTKTGLPLSLTVGICLGLATLLAGGAEGVLMIARYGAHTVGGPDGGPGLAFVNWSTGHGDLRVAHFFALHALQGLMIAGWMASRIKAAPRVQVLAVAVFSSVYLGGIWMLFRQAIHGHPLLG